jgi:hypothetical protein
MRFFMDCEFIENGPLQPIYLLSLGLVAEDGRELYVEDGSTPLGFANPWVVDNVLPKLKGPKLMPRELRREVLEFVNAPVTATQPGRKVGAPEFWSYYGQYDWVCFAQIFGAMVDFPQGWPQYLNDLQQWAHQLGVYRSEFPPHAGIEHNALDDARWHRDIHRVLQQHASARRGDP